MEKKSKENRLYCSVPPVSRFLPHRVSLRLAVLENSLCLVSLVLRHRQAAARALPASLAAGCPASTYKHMMKICLKKNGQCKGDSFCYVKVCGPSRDIMG